MALEMQAHRPVPSQEPAELRRRDIILEILSSSLRHLRRVLELSLPSW